VCLWLCTASVHNTTQNSSDNLPFYPRQADVVYWRRGVLWEVNGKRQFIKQHTIWEVVLIRGHIKKGRTGHAPLNSANRFVHRVVCVYNIPTSGIQRCPESTEGCFQPLKVCSLGHFVTQWRLKTAVRKFTKIYVPSPRWNPEYAIDSLHTHTFKKSTEENKNDSVNMHVWHRLLKCLLTALSDYLQVPIVCIATISGFVESVSPSIYKFWNCYINKNVLHFLHTKRLSLQAHTRVIFRGCMKFIFHSLIDDHKIPE